MVHIGQLSCVQTDTWCSQGSEASTLRKHGTYLHAGTSSTIPWLEYARPARRAFDLGRSAQPVLVMNADYCSAAAVYVIASDCP